MDADRDDRMRRGLVGEIFHLVERTRQQQEGEGPKPRHEREGPAPRHPAAEAPSAVGTRYKDLIASLTFDAGAEGNSVGGASVD
jgi:hypothetical protein